MLLQKYFKKSVFTPQIFKRQKILYPIIIFNQADGEDLFLRSLLAIVLLLLSQEKDFSFFFGEQFYEIAFVPLCFLPPIFQPDLVWGKLSQFSDLFFSWYVVV